MVQYKYMQCMRESQFLLGDCLSAIYRSSFTFFRVKDRVK